MARTKQPTAEKIEIIDQPEDLLEQGRGRPWFVVPLVVVLAALSAFFVIRRLFGQNEL